ncbi:MAG: hypothetical protein ACRYFK_11470 [Janthinobacterium lividum]
MSLTALYAWLQHGLANRYWRLWVIVACVAAAALGQLPPVRHTYRQLVAGTEVEMNFSVVRQQIANPWQAYSTIAVTHGAKMVFRLTLPLLARVLHLGVGHLLLLQVALGVLMYWWLAAALARLLADRVAGALLALGLSGTYFGYAFSSELRGCFDAYCYALLVAALLARRGWVIVGLVVVGGFVDERMLLASPLLVLWYGVAAYGWQNPAAWRYLLTQRAGAVYAAWGVYAGLRLYLAWHYHLPTYTGLVGLDALRINLGAEWLPLGYLSAFKAHLLLPIGAAIVLARRQAYGLLLLAGLCAAPIFLGCVLVTDITRSLAYGGPLLFSSVHLLGRATTVAQRRGLALALAASTLLLPSYHVLGAVLYLPSAPLAGLRWLLG